MRNIIVNRQEKSTKNIFLLALTALIWGVAFVAQSVGMEYVGPFTFNSVRFLIGGMVLLPVVMMSRKEKGVETDSQDGKQRVLVLGGLCCGMALCVASCLQQIGIGYTTVGKAGFITAMYIVIVPLLGIVLKKKTTWLVWISVVLASVGLYFLCMTETLSVGRGDLYVLACALVFSVHILLIDHFSPKVDGVALSCLQFLVSGVIAGVAALIWEQPDLASILAAWAPILYAGVLSSGVGYTLQVVGQKGVDPTVASLVLSLESVFSVLAGWVLLGQGLSGREWMGCGLMAVAIVLAQIPASNSVSTGVQ
ncbi:MAG: DMT family transporter [Lachnospiraceae bacterium]|nr:DMT family transporter [Lachnospiraceae bacterium]